MTHDPLCPDWWPSYESAEMNAAWWHGYNFACRSEGIIGAIELGAIGDANQQAYLNGQQDMLAKCIETAVKVYRNAPEGYSDNEAAELAFAALRALLDNKDSI
jgi:hypothetical protein